MAASLDGTNGLTFNDGTLMGSANSLGMRNRIINGDMRIDQRNAGAAVTVGLNPYLTDRFFSSNETGIGTITAQQLTLGNSRSLRLTATAAITDLTNQFKGIVQAIESQNCFDLNNKTVTVSFIVETNWTGNLAVAFRNSAATRAYVVNAAVVSGINNVSVTLPFEAATVATNNNLRGLEFFIGANSTNIDRRTATTGAWVAGVFICSTASTNWTTTAGNFINVTNVQLEEGSVATPFERRPIGLELALSQRYYEKSYALATAVGAATQVGASTIQTATAGTAQFQLTVKLVPKRAPASIVLYDLAGTISAVYRGGNGASGSAINIAESGFAILFNSGASATEFSAQWTASAEL